MTSIGSVALEAPAPQPRPGATGPPAMQRWLDGVLPSGGRPAANAAIGSVSGVMTIAGAALGGVLSA
jgi:hypothetical protein